jgi:Tfp pilus assembly protein PilF
VNETTNIRTEAIDAGLRFCRRGEWHSGLHYLRPLIEAPADAFAPSVAWSYLGHALARCERKHRDAVGYCKRSLELGFSEPENYLNLAWVHLLARDRAAAARAIERGLEADPKHAGLLALRGRIGVRRPPVLVFLPRANPLNVWLGRVRHALAGRAA